MADSTAALRSFLQGHKDIVVLTGAGCSVPSGIPDYRGPDGAWKHTKPMTFASFTGSLEARQRYWAGSLRGWPRVCSARPLELYDGKIRFVDATGKVVADQLDPRKYQAYIGEAVEPWTYLKFPYYKPLGYPGGMYRVGPLARLNVASHCGTPGADRELAEFRQLGRGAVLSSFHYHYARLIEILFSIEKVEEILDHSEILSEEVIAHARRNRYEGVGCSEAPRGTLFHHYKVKGGGLITWANFIIATGQNNLPMNQTVLQIAKHFVDGKKLKEGMLNRVEAGIRAFDPCLSCSTHAYGEMPLKIELVEADGTVVDTVARD